MPVRDTPSGRKEGSQVEGAALHDREGVAATVSLGTEAAGHMKLEAEI